MSQQLRNLHSIFAAPEPGVVSCPWCKEEVAGNDCIERTDKSSWHHGCAVNQIIDDLSDALASFTGRDYANRRAEEYRPVAKSLIALWDATLTEVRRG